MKYIYQAFFFCILISVGSIAHATQIQGGEIRVTGLSPLKYRISVLVYFDMNQGASTAAPQTSVQLCMGDGQIVSASQTSFSSLPNSRSSIGVYETEYSYTEAGTYQISSAIENRSAGILNLPGDPASSLFLWTVLNTELANTTPVLPFFQFEAGIGQPFMLDLTPTDAEGDSVSYRIQKISKPSPGSCGVRSVDRNFVYPNDVSKSGIFKIDQTNKKLIWNSPTQVGSYLIAFVVLEWRNGIIISETYREGVINAVERPGETAVLPPYEEASDGVIPPSLPHLPSPEISMAIEAYPVPAEDVVTVKVYNQSQSYITLELIDLKGRILQSFKSPAPQTSFQQEIVIRNYAKGIYLIRAKNGRESVSQKIMR
jgi:hypothetical protein